MFSATVTEFPGFRQSIGVTAVLAAAQFDRKGDIAVKIARFITVLAMAFALVISVQAGSANGGKDMIAGSAHFGFADVHVNATSDPNGANPRGWWRFEQGPGIDLVGQVTCLHVFGNSARLSGVITVDNVTGALVGTYFLQFVEDAGSPGAAGDNSVTLNFGLLADPGCAGGDPGGIAATGGNYVVKDV